MILDFPYTVDDEPTEDWTVDQVLHWWMLHSKCETDAVCENMIQKLQQQLTAGKLSLWKDHEQVVHTMEQQHEQQQESENTDPQFYSKQQKQQSQSLNKSSSKPSPHKQDEHQQVPMGTLKVDIVSGMYTGEIFHLDVSGSKVAMVGRSQAKRFVNNGMSLSKDPEVSTTHGKFFSRQQNYYYVDDGSTNGSLVNGEPIESHEEILLNSGMELTVGATTMRVSFA